MKRIPIILSCVAVLAALSSCGKQNGKLLIPDSSRWTDQDIPLSEVSKGNVNTDSSIMMDKMRAAFSPGDTLVSGRPVSFYLKRDDISKTAKDFYLMNFIPSDDDATFAMCDSLITKNDTTRPFYFFLFMRVIRIADGALDEGISQYASKYVLQYPEDFFKRIDEPIYKQYYSDWVSTVAYDFIVPNIQSPSPDDVKNYITSQQEKHIKRLTPILKSKIEMFAGEVAKQTPLYWQ